MDNLHESVTDKDIKRKKRVYTRDELFRLASLMDEYESMADMLNEHKNYDYEQQNKLLSPPDNDDFWMKDFECLPQSFASFGRKKSDLINGIKSNIPRNVDFNLARSAGHNKKLYRMSSSPTIKYNKGGNDLAAFNNLPSQVRLKYARLIDTIKSKTCGKPQPGQQSDVHQFESIAGDNRLGRDLSSPEPVVSGVKPRRPESLFGPLRRRSEDCRKSSDEPMSLPYSINAPATTLTTSQTGANSNRSPERRHSLSHGRANKYEFANQDEDDDFDISSLLSITVLSDIRFIRQELNQAQSTKLVHQRSLEGAKAPPNQTRSHDTPVMTRLPPRSRTSLEFNCETRRANQHLVQEALPSFLASRTRAHDNLTTRPPTMATTTSSALTDQRQSTYLIRQASFDPYGSLEEPTSLPYNWRANSSSAWCIDPQVALEYHLKKTRESNNKKQASNGSKKDDKTSQENEKDLYRANKIIEAFKAQVLARAKEDDTKRTETKTDAATRSTDAGTGSKPASELRSQEAREDGSNTVNKDNALGTVEGDKQAKEAASDKAVKSGGEGESAEANTDQAATSGCDKFAEPSETVTDSGQNSGQQTISQRSEATISATTKASDVSDSRNGDNRSNSTQRCSNIPRLISLHRANSRVSPNKQDEVTGECQSLPLDEDQANSRATGQEKAPTSELDNIKAGNKFVSKYKGLRGKSLADEVQESV